MNNSGYVVLARTQDGDEVLLWDFAASHKTQVETKLYYHLLKMGVTSAEQEQHLKSLSWEIVKFDAAIAY